MRRGTLIFLFINLFTIGVLVNAFSTLIALLITTGEADAIHRAEIPAPGSDMIETRTQLIPKIIHQTYINESIPDRWLAGQKSCKDLHEDYEYILWTDAKSREFIAAEYPWALSNFDSYSFPIQRADAIRYFILAHYGGIYIDLDDGCNRRLDPLLSYPAWARRTLPTGISNDALGSVPQHPFFLRTIESLAGYNRNWFMPYVTVMYSTGPLFLSVLWVQYMRDKRPLSEHVRILLPEEYKGFTWSFFNVTKGNSWHGKDAETIFWMGKHWFFLTVTGFAVAGVVGSVMWWAWNVWIVRGKRVNGGKNRSGLRLLRRISGKERYELVDRLA
ncbi:probable CSH1 Probable catalytic subunit of a mannosylinositol phosphorylceramide (MIPC) synthase [Rhynchosporium secalis]|uniref:Probable CSH1 Probable catalytic subunit of a mannosylinositol phosphorylceramide (MIPC) synthase n=1 Tax=Rhynchosporium secalis TaxID=38038 RepID=A0A1E1MBD1_RHYSE|nr:probable CSH1 Probable catalytic subunit of a mannosylinositol phosphorylceramide (MIPC) synthase [Rhynchosporium secalis]